MVDTIASFMPIPESTSICKERTGKFNIVNPPYKAHVQGKHVFPLLSLPCEVTSYYFLLFFLFFSLVLEGGEVSRARGV